MSNRAQWSLRERALCCACLCVRATDGEGERERQDRRVAVHCELDSEKHTHTRMYTRVSINVMAIYFPYIFRSDIVAMAAQLRPNQIPENIYHHLISVLYFVIVLQNANIFDFHSCEED